MDMVGIVLVKMCCTTNTCRSPTETVRREQVRPQVRGRHLRPQAVYVGLHARDLTRVDVGLTLEARDAVAVQPVAFSLQASYALQHRARNGPR